MKGHVAEAEAGNVVPLEGMVAMPVLQKALLFGIVLALLLFVLRKRRRTASMVNEKSLT